MAITIRNVISCRLCRSFETAPADNLGPIFNAFTARAFCLSSRKLRQDHSTNCAELAPISVWRRESRPKYRKVLKSFGQSPDTIWSMAPPSLVLSKF